MSSVLLDRKIAAQFAPKIRLVATDMDGTLTQQGQFTPGLLAQLLELARSQISVVIVTGRSAGWVSGLAHYLPVWGAIAENGGLLYASDRNFPLLLNDIKDPIAHRQNLARVFESLQRDFPHLQESADNPFRITDWTFDVKGLSQVDLQQMAASCQEQGWDFVYSTVQCHIKPFAQEKAAAVLRVLEDYFPQLDRDRVLTVGDSPNDRSLFDPSNFPHSVGVANIADYLDLLPHPPAYLTQGMEGDGFGELVRYLLAARI
ncbi:HAD family phosphatase [Oscillatoriales cyanobacterium LEGE 11467]|uniref:HAD family phosphatase n=1 Tax=Zarconia navalis LEGE 11467 TaxID=1828826 RepID=A0A928W187_9CYAN|nr:HAD family hydrolase [Zarconia navalis]MBE9042028.1 HAD family phosphatase [Zarconia navalis LEGE 11467]